MAVARQLDEPAVPGSRLVADDDLRKGARVQRVREARPGETPLGQDVEIARTARGRKVARSQRARESRHRIRRRSALNTAARLGLRSAGVQEKNHRDSEDRKSADGRFHGIRFLLNEWISNYSGQGLKVGFQVLLLQVRKFEIRPWELADPSGQQRRVGGTVVPPTR